MPRWLLVALISVSGCAYSLSGPDPNWSRTEPPRCDTSKALVGFDGVIAATMGVAALSLVAEEPGVALLPVAIGALYLGGAIKGNNAVNRCRAARSDYEQLSVSYPRTAPLPSDDDEPRPRRRRPVNDGFDAREAATAIQPPRGPTPAAPVPSAPAPVPSAPPVATRPSPAPVGPAPRLPVPVFVDAENDWSDFWREVP